MEAAGPRGDHGSGGDRPGVSLCRAVIPDRARTSHRRNWPRWPLFKNGPEGAGAQSTPSSGALRACRPKGRTTARAGGEKEGPTLMLPLALWRLGPGSESGPGLGTGLRETRGMATRAVRVVRPANLIHGPGGSRVRPGTVGGERWGRWGVEGQIHTSGLDQGSNTVPSFAARAGRASLGAGGELGIGAKLDACSPGEVGGIRGPVAGRARKGAGWRSPDTPQYDSDHSQARSESGTARKALGPNRPWSACWACE